MIIERMTIPAGSLKFIEKEIIAIVRSREYSYRKQTWENGVDFILDNKFCFCFYFSENQNPTP
jgi:hypothetical protein